MTRTRQGNDAFDAVALEFDIQLKEKGKLQIQFVYASDEHPEWTNLMKDDIFGVYVKGPGIPLQDQNFITIVQESMPLLMGIDRIAICEELRILNRATQDPNRLIPAGTPQFNHEYTLFSRLLTRETKQILEPGTYHVKLVINDVDDPWVDSAAFIPMASFRLNPCVMQAGDFGGNGLVEQEDLDLVLTQWGKSFSNIPTSWIVHRPLSGVIDQNELDAVLIHWGNDQATISNYKADFNRDGSVTKCDKDILDQWMGMTHCASVFEGDANGDGAVDATDEALYNQETNGEDCCEQPTCCGQGEDGTDNAAAGGAPDNWKFGHFDLVLDAVAWTQFPLPPGGGSQGPTPAPQPADWPQPAPSYVPQPAPQPAPPLQPIPESQPLAEQLAQVQPAQVQPTSEQVAQQQPSLKERLTTPNPAASGHARSHDIQEILDIAADYYFASREQDAHRIWSSMVRVFGEDVMPEVLEISW